MGLICINLGFFSRFVMAYYTIKQRRHGRQKCAGIKRYTHTPSIRYMNLENISNLRNVFLENKVWRFVHEWGKYFDGS